MARHVAHGRGCDVHLAARDRHVGARVTNRAPWGSCGRLNETSDAFPGARRGVHETRDTFAGGKWPEIGCFVRAKASAVSNVCGEELAVVSVVSSRDSDPPALVSSVSGEAVGGCCEVAVAPVSAKKFAHQEWILERTAKKFALQAKKR